MPVYLTFKQANDLGAHVKKGESAMPVLYWDIMARDKGGHKITKEAYRKMSLAERMQVQTIPFLKAYNVFNIDQTNLSEVKPDKVEALKKLFAPPELCDAEGMFTSKALDRMFEKQEWICPIQYDKQVPGAYFSPSKDIIVIPRKEQFNIGKTPEEVYKDGMEYYSTALHEMAHSTGTESRLNRGSHEKFGDAKYAKEELVAELTAAMVGNSMGFDKRILDNNAAYLDGWISTLKENPKFIVSVIADVNKAANMVLEEVDRQKIALGEEPLLDKNRNLSADTAKDEIAFENASIIKQNDGDYAVRASYQGQDLGLKPIDRNVGILYFSLSEEAEKARLLSHTLEKSYGDIILSQGQRRSHGMKI
jgi:putative DNA primase